jgi:hypothetical protein
MPRLKRGMTVEERDSAFSRRDAPEVFMKFVPLRTEGAENAGRLVRPQPRVVGSKHAR